MKRPKIVTPAQKPAESVPDAPPPCKLTAPQVEAIEAALSRALERVRTGGSGMYGIRFELGIPDVNMRIVVQREAVKLQVLPRKVVVPKRKVVRP